MTAATMNATPEMDRAARHNRAPGTNADASEKQVSATSNIAKSTARAAGFPGMASRLIVSDAGS